MNQKPGYSALGPDGDNAVDTVEMHNLGDRLLDSPTRQPLSKIRKTLRFLHPIAWLLLICIGGPILLRKLAVRYLRSDAQLNGLELALPCDVQDVWTSWSTLFEINIRRDNLSFTDAKIIDVAFDLVVGRGGQLCLGWMAYRVYADVLTRIAEKEHIRYNVFAAIALHPNDITTLATALISAPSAKTIWTKSALVWTALTMSYVMARPTAISAATSLVGVTRTGIQLSNNGGIAPIAAYVASAAYSIARTSLEDKPDPWIVPVAYVNGIGSSIDGNCNI
ncbi:MAG: hypothetical protein MMC23_006657 [Stictis urceolatum]|nr:hypothetical protein [Stictis urceolata]